MPNEFDDLMRVRDEKKLPEEEYRKVYDEYDSQADKLSKKI